MERYDQLYRLYSEFDTGTLRDYQRFLDVFPPVDSRVALEYWDAASAERDRRMAEIRDAFPAAGDRLAAVAARADREQAFAAQDLLSAHGRGVNALVLDVDETLRSAGSTDNEIPRETLYLLSHFQDRDGPLIVSTGQTLEHVKGFAIQGLGDRVVYSGRLSVVYEGGTGVFTPGRGPDTKLPLYHDLDADVHELFDWVRARALSAAPEAVARGCHLQGNEFNVTLKPNAARTTEPAQAIVETALTFLVELVGEAAVSVTSVDAMPKAGRSWSRQYFTTTTPEVESVLGGDDGQPQPQTEVPPEVRDLLAKVTVAHHVADSAEIAPRELDKARGVRAALDVLNVNDPFVLAMGDSTSDLAVMEWVTTNQSGVTAAPDHADSAVREHVRSHDGIQFDRGNAAHPLRVVYAMNRLADRNGEPRSQDPTKAG